MKPKPELFINDFDTDFKVFHDLMSAKVHEILIVSSPYDAFIMEENGSLSSRIINEYKGLNLSSPPRLALASSAYEALEILNHRKFDIVITTPHLDDMDAFELGLKIKKTNPELPVILMSHSLKGVYPLPENRDCSGIDRTFVWTGDSDLLVAIVKNVEDSLNVEYDTQKAMVRVLIFIEDSPIYRSSFLPLIYKEVVKQTQCVMEEGLNEEHRLLKERARPKILIAETYEEAMELYNKFSNYVIAVISDCRFPKNNVMDNNAGFDLLSHIRTDIPYRARLMLSSQPENRERALGIEAVFVDKSSSNLYEEIHQFFLDYLGFGDFVFRLADGKEVGRASSIRGLEKILPKIPDEPMVYHAKRHRFSNWLMARSEIALAFKFRDVEFADFKNIEELKQYIIDNIHILRQRRQRGVVAQFMPNEFDSDVMDFVKIGNGSIGGKARGLAFMASLLQKNSEIHKKFPNVNIIVPKTLVITTDGFTSFITQNKLRYSELAKCTDKEITRRFLEADMPDLLQKQIEAFLSVVKGPLSVRSSSLLEDAQFQPYAGLYSTYMIPNNDYSSHSIRIRQLITAVKLVYASTYFESPRAFSQSTLHQAQEDSMAVIIQQLAGKEYGDYFYPAISGVAQSHNFYPVSYMKAEDGIAHIALGMGKTVVEGEKTLRFSPKYPNIMPQFSTVDDILDNSQRYFYALKIKDYPEALSFRTDCNLEKRELDEAENELPVKILSSTYIPEEHRIRDTSISGVRVLTFAQMLKYNLFPLSELLSEFLKIGRKGMGCPIEMEFAVDLDPGKGTGDFFFLQIRPMVASEQRFEVNIAPKEFQRAFCYSTQALGTGINESIADIIYVKPDDFNAKSTMQIASEIGQINAGLVKENRPYLLAGPGRWGSADRWLGIPVQWRDISGVSAIIELRNEKLKADPSQGSHFFQNITSLGIYYITITEGSDDFFNWEWIKSLPTLRETDFLRHVRLDQPFTIKVNAKNAQCVMFEKEKED
ncbi:Phosphoenolpyruvate synthase/pyruvate phosphate dikinase [Candidatus Magnetomoraceae bacterium gMMP-15]